MRKKCREEVGNLSVEGSKRTHRPLLRVRGDQVAGLGFPGGGEEFGDLDREEEGGNPADTNCFDCVGNSAVRRETLGVG